jgi:hypothetical protein
MLFMTDQKPQSQDRFCVDLSRRGTTVTLLGIASLGLWAAFHAQLNRVLGETLNAVIPAMLAVRLISWAEKVRPNPEALSYRQDLSR